MRATAFIPSTGARAVADLFGGLDDQPRAKPKAQTVRASSSGKTSAFEAVDTGSNPVARSTAAPSNATCVKREIAAKVCASPRLVASFACPCGAQEELLEPAPATVNCWHCKAPLSMHRWWPPTPPPSGNARRITETERRRL